MKRWLLVLFFLPYFLKAQTAVFPSAVVTDSALLVAADNTTTTLTVPMTLLSTSMTVQSGTGFITNTVATVGGAGGEQVQICGVAGTTISLGKSSCPNIDGRGIGGTTIATHASTSPVGLYQSSLFHNATRVEMEAVEQTLGANLANITWSKINGAKQGSTTVPQMAGTNSGVLGASLCIDVNGNATTAGCPAAGTALPTATAGLQYPRIAPNAGNNTTFQMASPVTFNSGDYFIAPQFPGGSLVANGSTVVTVSPVPLGMNGSDVSHSVWVGGGIGTAEACSISGGSAVAGNSTGSIILNCVNAHSGAWSLQSISGGLTEAICALPLAGGEVWINQSVTLLASVSSCGKTQPVVRKLSGPVVTGSTFTILGSSSFTSGALPAGSEVRTGNLFLAPVINQAAGLGNIVIEPTATTGNTSTAFFNYMEQTDSTKLSSNIYMNGYGVNVYSSNPQPNQDAAFIGFWSSLGGADAFGGDFHGLIDPAATANPAYVIGVEGAAELNSATKLPTVASWPVLAVCRSTAVPAKNCTSMYGATSNGAGSNFILTTDSNIMTGEGVVLDPADDNNLSNRAFAIVNHSNTQNNFYASKGGYVYSRLAVTSQCFNCAVETGASANYALVANLSDPVTVANSVTVSGGFCVTITLQHALRSGVSGNTLALNGGGPVAIMSNLNPATQIASGRAVGSVLYTCNNGTVWVDMAQ